MLILSKALIVSMLTCLIMSAACRHVTITTLDCAKGDPCRAPVSDEEVWVQNPNVPESEGALVSAIDFASVRAIGDERRVWLCTTYSEYSARGGIRFRSHYIIDCPRGTLQADWYELLEPSGDISARNPAQLPWPTRAPTPAGKLEHFLCDTPALEEIRSVVKRVRELRASKGVVDWTELGNRGIHVLEFVVKEESANRE
jgi:hypothetical protein